MRSPNEQARFDIAHDDVVDITFNVSTRCKVVHMVLSELFNNSVEDVPRVREIAGVAAELALPRVREAQRQLGSFTGRTPAAASGLLHTEIALHTAVLAVHRALSSDVIIGGPLVMPDTEWANLAAWLPLGYCALLDQTDAILNAPEPAGAYA